MLKTSMVLAGFVEEGLITFLERSYACRSANCGTHQLMFTMTGTKSDANFFSLREDSCGCCLMDFYGCWSVVIQVLQPE